MSHAKPMTPTPDDGAQAFTHDKLTAQMDLASTQMRQIRAIMAGKDYDAELTAETAAREKAEASLSLCRTSLRQAEEAWGTLADNGNDLRAKLDIAQQEAANLSGDLIFRAEAERDAAISERDFERHRAESWKQTSDAHAATIARLRDALELIAAPKRPDGTYNRSREACEQLARKALAANPEAKPPFATSGYEGECSRCGCHFTSPNKREVVCNPCWDKHTATAQPKETT